MHKRNIGVEGFVALFNARRWLNIANGLKGLNKADADCLGEVDRDGIADLLVLTGECAAEVPCIGEGLDAGVFAHGEGAAFNGVATLGLVLGGGAGEREAGCVPRKAPRHTGLPAGKGVASFHIFALQRLR